MRTFVAALLFCSGLILGIISLPIFNAVSSGEQKQEKPAADSKKPKTAERSDAIVMNLDQMTKQGIKLAAAKPGALQRHLIVPGLITPAPDRVARVPARVVGTVAEMRKQLGDHVEAGDIVAVLDSREVAEAKSEYLTARVNLDLQQTNYDRSKSLWEKRVSPEAQYLQAQATFSESQLRVDLARQKLSALGLDARTVLSDAEKEKKEEAPSTLRKYELRAPLSGRIIERKVDVGTAVGKEGDPADLYTIADLSTIWVDLSVPTFQLEQIKEGAAVQISAAGEQSEKRQEAKLIFISPVLSSDTRSARVIAAIPNKEGLWRPGDFISAEVEIARETVPVLVPHSAIQRIDFDKVVFVRTEAGFEKREIKVGRSDDDSVEILSGLKAGEQIAVANSFLLKAELGKSEAADD